MLTPRQKQLKDYIHKIISEKGVAPTEREIARRFKISPSTTHEHITALQRKGYL
ncbi:MAG: winged helix-turn-helix transcriptional regulator [Candidatus Ryanbacteria bacterium]|nr:winged helix-turn-helix transcriptional regulator [Candidatus Ryanbacteria bacterium]